MNSEFPGFQINYGTKYSYDGQKYWPLVNSDLNLDLGQGHDTPFESWKTPVLSSEVTNENIKLGQRFWLCVHWT